MIPPTRAPPTTYSALALWRAMRAGAAVYVDIRTTAEFNAGHAPGAICIPLYEADVAGQKLQLDFVDRVRALRQRRPAPCALVLACRTGARSRQALQVLRASGVSGVAELPGGWCGQVDSWGRVRHVGWLAAGLPDAMAAARGATESAADPEVHKPENP